MIAILFFGGAGIISIKKLFSRKPGLVFNNLGIIDNSSGVSLGTIPWAEIIGAKITEVHHHQFLLIMVKNPQKYIEWGGPLKQVLNKKSYEMFGSPISIAVSTLKTDLPELLALFEEYKKKYGDQQLTGPITKQTQLP